MLKNVCPWRCHAIPDYIVNLKLVILIINVMLEKEYPTELVSVATLFVAATTFVSGQGCNLDFALHAAGTFKTLENPPCTTGEQARVHQLRIRRKQRQNTTILCTCSPSADMVQFRDQRLSHLSMLKIRCTLIIGTISPLGMLRTQNTSSGLQYAKF